MTTDAVNGIVQCKGFEEYAYRGFQARYADGRWESQAVPYVAEEDHLEEVGTPEPRTSQARPVPSVATLDGRTFGAAIDGLAAYEPQRTCSGTAKPGTLAMRNLLLRDNAGSRNLGIVRGCGIGGTSEHKEGRAFDWGVNARTPRERAYADASPHTDHVHISLSRAGANARTSFWSGEAKAKWEEEKAAREKAKAKWEARRRSGPTTQPEPTTTTAAPAPPPTTTSDGE